MPPATDEAHWHVENTYSNVRAAAAGEDGAYLGVYSAILRFDGREWEHFRKVPHDLRSMWVSAEGTLYLGYGDGLYRIDHSGMHMLTDTGAQHICGTAEDSIYINTNTGVHLYDGTTTTLLYAWDTINYPRSGPTSIWASSPSNVYATLDYWVYRYDGDSWAQLDPDTVHGGAVWGTGPDNVYVVSGGTQSHVFHFDGTEWSSAAVPSMNIEAIFGSGPSDIYLAGRGGHLAHFDGTEWTAETTHTGQDFFTGATHPSVGTVVGGEHGAAGARAIDGSWSSLSRFGYAVGEPWVSPSGKAYLPFDNAVVIRDGEEWQLLPPPPEVAGGLGRLYGVWGRSDIDWFGWGETYIVHHGMDGWGSELTSGVFLPQSIHGEEDLVVCVGKFGRSEETKFRHRDGEEWVEVGEWTDGVLYDVWVASSSHAFAVGDLGTIYEFDNGEWGEVASPVTTRLLSVTGTSTRNVFAVGENGVLLHRDGREWAEVQTDVVDHIGTIAPAKNGLMLAGTSGGELLHVNAVGVARTEEVWYERITGIAATSNGDIYVTASNGTVLRFGD